MRNIEAAQRARSQAARINVWNAVEAARERHPDCHCDLSMGATLAELRPLGAGCRHPNYVCPVLDTYRRLLGGSEPPPVNYTEVA